MNRGDVGLVLGLAGFLLGGISVFVAVGAKSETATRWKDVQDMVKSDQENMEGWGAKLEGFNERLKGLDARAARGNDTAIWEAVHDLQARAAILESHAGIQRAKPALVQPTPKEIEEAEKKRQQEEKK
jgi:hypothetical protein